MAKGAGGKRYKAAAGGAQKFPMTSQKNKVKRNAAGRAIGM